MGGGRNSSPAGTGWIYLYPLSTAFEPLLSEGYSLSASYPEKPQLAVLGDSLYALASSPTQIGCIFLKRLCLKKPEPTPTPAPKPVPKTGDPGNPLLWSGLALAGFGGFPVITRRNRRYRLRRKTGKNA